MKSELFREPSSVAPVHHELYSIAVQLARAARAVSAHSQTIGDICDQLSVKPMSPAQLVLSVSDATRDAMWDYPPDVILLFAFSLNSFIPLATTARHAIQYAYHDRTPWPRPSTPPYDLSTETIAVSYYDRRQLPPHVAEMMLRARKDVQYLLKLCLKYENCWYGNI